MYDNQYKVIVLYHNALLILSPSTNTGNLWCKGYHDVAADDGDDPQDDSLGDDD